MFKKNITNKGFTIIEVLIVLTIATAILLVVFLSVPALQRNSRNSSYRQEAQRILGAVQENVSNNGGNQLVISTCTDLVTTAGGCLVSPGVNDANRIMLLADPQNISSLSIEAFNATQPAPTLTRSIIRLTSKCGTGASANTVVSGAGRQVALVYQIEDNAGAGLTQCISS